jgi:hypothetical protein
MAELSSRRLNLFTLRRAPRGPLNVPHLQVKKVSKPGRLALTHLALSLASPMSPPNHVHFLKFGAHRATYLLVHRCRLGVARP